MNSCKHCGKEIAEGRKFCNNSCAAKYNNAHRVRKPWTEEQHLKNKAKEEERYCKYCGKILDRAKGERQTCREHRNIQARLTSLKKLKCTAGLSDLRAYEVGMGFLYREYVLNCKSITQISKETGLWEVSIKRLLNVQGIQLRTFAEADRLALETGRKCPSSRAVYSHGRHMSWENKEIYYRSSYELEYAQQLDEQKVHYEVETKRIRYFDTVLQKERIAIPDFYLPETNELVEIKSSWTYNEQNMKDKFKAYRDSGYNPILILNKKQMPL